MLRNVRGRHGRCELPRQELSKVLSRKVAEAAMSLASRKQCSLHQYGIASGLVQRHTQKIQFISLFFRAQVALQAADLSNFGQ